MKNNILGFIGAGNMASAIIKGVIHTNEYSADHICVYDIDSEKYDTFSKKGINTAMSATDLVKNCDTIFLSIKPQNFPDVLEEIKHVVDEEKLFVTIAAGISTDYISGKLQCDCPIVRAMPNTPLLIGEGATALCKNSHVTDENFQLIKSIFRSCGTVSVLDESLMNAVISVNGSSPAYIYLFAKAVIDSAIKQGIPEEIALPLICKTLQGSASMLLKSGHTPEQLIKMVSSPGGTTLKALDVLYDHNFEETIDKAMVACTKRAEELGK